MCRVELISEKSRVVFVNRWLEELRTLKAQRDGRSQHGLPRGEDGRKRVRSAVDLLLRLDRLGFDPVVAGDRFQVTGPLTPALVETIRQHEHELLELVRRREDRKGQAQEITRLLRERGWVPVSGGPFRGRIVVLVRDETVAVPEIWQGYERRTVRELMGASADGAAD